MGFGLITGSLLAAGASGAMGAASGLLNKGKKASVPTYTPHEKRLTGASQALIPNYLNSIAGRSTPYLQRLLAQMRAQGQQQAGMSIQDYLRQIGMRGGADFGPGAYRQLGQMYQGNSANIMQAIAQARLANMQTAQQGLQQWSMIKPGTMSQPKAPSTGSQAAAGALQGFSQFLGTKGPGPKAPGGGGSAPVYQGAPYAQQQTAQQVYQAQPRQQLNQITSQATGLNRYLPNGIPGF